MAWWFGMAQGYWCWTWMVMATNAQGGLCFTCILLLREESRWELLFKAGDFLGFPLV
jgi:hypothetical protein